MTKLGMKRKAALFFVNHIFHGTRYFEIKRKFLNFAEYKIGKGTKIVGPIYLTGELTIGDDCWIGKDFTVNGNGKVYIGNFCDIAPNVVFQTGTHLIGNQIRRAGKGRNYDIIVGSGCWIGVGVTFVNEIRLENAIVVAACACVTKSFRENVLIGGIPAKIIRELDYESITESKK